MELAGKYNIAMTPSVAAHFAAHPEDLTPNKGLKQSIDKSLTILQNPASDETQVNQAMIELNTAQQLLAILNRLEVTNYR